MSVIIRAENISKAYQLGQIGTGTLSRDIERMFAKLRGKEDPFLKIGEANDRSVKGTSDVAWSLRDIDFEIEAGDAVGIIGKNGAGKSTLLKILSRITSPTTGRIDVYGRIASLLEVGTGFHPELSGRENIYLNGAILGMRKAEIKSKFDEIVDFSGVARYIDTPVKRYSSGMYVRLAFAVAAHLEPEILIVDEVLAVGDAEFQKKCLGKMKDVSVNDGRTVLFVSHNMGAVLQLCPKAMLLKNGQLVDSGTSDKVIDNYLKGLNNNLDNYFLYEERNDKAYFTKACCLNNSDEIIYNFRFTENVNLNIEFVVNEEIPGMILGIGIQDKFQNRVTTFLKDIKEIDKSGNVYTAKVRVPSNIIAPNNYTIVLALWNRNGKVYQLIESTLNFSITDDGTDFALFEGGDHGNVYLQPTWK